MESSTILYNRLGWLILALAFLLGVVHIAASIFLSKRSKQVVNPEQHRRLSKRILLLAFAGTAFMCLLFTFWGLFFIPALAYSYQREVVSCLQTPVADGYILVIEDKRNGEREVHLEDSQRTQRFIWSITKFQVTRSYVIGETSFLLGDRDYFWFNFATRASFDTSPTMDFTSEDQHGFLASLATQGLAPLSEYHPVESLCRAGECVPCADSHR